MNNNVKNNSEAPILQSTKELYIEFYGYLKLFPKKDQYLIGRRCEDIILDFIEDIITAAGSPREMKLNFLIKASVQFDLLKVLFRTARDLKLLTDSRYISLTTKTLEIGRQLGGWLKSVNTKTH